MSSEKWLPYRALWASVILTAVKDMDERDREEAASAKKWIYSPSAAPHSLKWICSNLDLDVNFIQHWCMTRSGRKALVKLGEYRWL